MPVLITFEGITDTLKGWSKRTGLNEVTLGDRLRRGTSLEEALKTRPGHLKRQNGRNFSIHEVCPNHDSMGMVRTRIYNTYCNMVHRCYSATHKAYPDYGGRGITVCDHWLGADGTNGFLSFYEDMLGGTGDQRRGYFLERLDNNGPYEKDNCSFVTRKAQQNNQRRSPRFRMLTYQGETKSAPDWARIYHIPAKRILGRKRDGWSDEQAITTPMTKYKSHRKSAKQVSTPPSCAALSTTP
jgi:hypothetical protein